MTQCEARRSDGRRCTRLVMRGRKVCHYHAGEDRREFMRQIAYKANEAKRKQKVEREAVRKPISSVAEAELILGSLIAQLHANHAPAKDLVAAIGCFLKSRELSLEAEIARISDQVAKMKLARTGRGVVDDWLPGQQEEFVDESEE